MSFKNRIMCDVFMCFSGDLWFVFHWSFPQGYQWSACLLITFQLGNAHPSQPGRNRTSPNQVLNEDPLPYTGTQQPPSLPDKPCSTHTKKAVITQLTAAATTTTIERTPATPPPTATAPVPAPAAAATAVISRRRKKHYFPTYAVVKVSWAHCWSPQFGLFNVLAEQCCSSWIFSLLRPTKSLSFTPQVYWAPWAFSSLLRLRLRRSVCSNMIG